MKRKARAGKLCQKEVATKQGLTSCIEPQGVLMLVITKLSALLETFDSEPAAISSFAP
jgi:hypothetical protein